MAQHQFLALDLGAESGRGEIVTLADGRVTMEEVHRFPNRPVRMVGTLHWDLPFLLAELQTCMKLCSQRGVKLSGIGVDTWGTDFGLLGCDGRLVGLPVHYRDSRTDKIHEYSSRFMSQDAIFEATGYEPWSLASLFQLLAMQRDGWPTFKMAQTFLNMPDLLNYFLTGLKVSEMSVANTSNLMSVDCKWSEEIIGTFDLPRGMFGKLVPPATVLGPLAGGVADLVGLKDVPVIAVAGHDTSAAVAAVPATGDNWAYLSCGTWSIMGAMIDKPVVTRRCRELGYTNEYTIGGWYLGCNILGLWLVQELRRKWDHSADKWDYARMTSEAAAAKTDAMFDVAHPSLMVPPDMEAAILTLLKKSKQPLPDGRGQLVRCVLESLALEYACRLDAAAELAGRKPAVLYMVGGGIKNTLLCQLTANACGIPVHAGADQCTALGNALGQALALGILRGRQEIREVMRASSGTTVYQPAEADRWVERKIKYAAMHRGK